MADIIRDWKILKFERNDTSLNEWIEDFYDSTEKIQISNYLLAKTSPVDVTFDIPTTSGIEKTVDIGQKFIKSNNLNIFHEKSRNIYNSSHIEKCLFNEINISKYSHASLCDVKNKYENYIIDNTSGLLFKIDISSILNNFNNDTYLANLLSKTGNSYIKPLFDIYSIDILEKRGVSYEESVNYYHNYITPYFKPQTNILKSSIAINRFLYDQFYIDNRNSFILFDMSNDSDIISVYFFKVAFNQEYIKISSYKFNITWSLYHYYFNQCNSIDFTEYSNTDQTIFDFVQQNYSINNGSSDKIGSIHKISSDYNGYDNPIQYVYSGCKNKQFCIGGLVNDYTFQLSNLTSYSSSNVLSITIEDMKQHVKISDTSYSSLFTAKITTVNNKQFRVPFVIDSNLVNEYLDISCYPIIDISECTLFNQNELNSKFDTSQNILQDVFDITYILDNQTFNTNTGEINLDISSIIISNSDVTISIDSDYGIIKVNDLFINQYQLIDRNLYGIEDPQNFSVLNITDSLPAHSERLTRKTPFGIIKDGHIKSNVQDDRTCSSLFKSGKFIGSFGNSIKYGIEIPTGADSTITPITYSNLMHNIIDNTDLRTAYVYSDTSNIVNTSNAGYSGFYNPFSKKIYAISKNLINCGNGSQENVAYLNIQNLLDNSVNVIQFANTEYYWGLPYASDFVLDKTSILFIKDNTDYDNFGEELSIGFSKISFDNINDIAINSYLQYYPSKYHFGSACLTIPINGTSRYIYDTLGNCYLEEFNSVLGYTGVYYLYSSKITMNKFNRFNFPSNYKMFRLDQTTIIGLGTTITTNTFTIDGTVHGGLAYAFILNDSDITMFGGYEGYYGSRPVRLASITTGYTFFNDNTTILTSYYEPSYSDYNYRTSHYILDSTAKQVIQKMTTENKLSYIEDNTAFLFGINHTNFYTYNISTRTISTLAPIPNSNFILNIQAQKFKDNTFYFIGHDSSSSDIVFIEASYNYDLTAYTEIRKVSINKIPNLSLSEYNQRSTGNNKIIYGNPIECINDNTYVIYLTYNDIFLYFEIDSTSSSVNCKTSSSSTFLLSDENNDVDYRMGIVGSRYISYYNGRLCLFYGGSPFVVDGFDTKTQTIKFKKMWDERFFDYIISPTHKTNSDDSIASQLGYNLQNNEKNYLTYPKDTLTNTAIYRRGQDFKNTNIFSEKIFISTIDLAQSRMNYGKSFNDVNFNLFSAKNDLIGFEFECYKLYNASNKKNLIGTKFNIPMLYSKKISYEQEDLNNSFVRSNKVFSYKIDDQIYIYSLGSVYYYDITNDEIYPNNINTGYHSESCMMTSRYISSILGSYPYIYSTKLNRLFHLPINYKNDDTLSDIIISDKYIIHCNSGIYSPTYDSFSYNILDIFNPHLNNYAYRYFDDNSNIIQNNEMEQYVITRPQFYNNLFNSDICTKTFNKYSSSIHTCNDDSKQILGMGQTYQKNKFDKVVVGEIIFDSTTIIKSAKINDEMSLFYKLLSPFNFNANYSSYMFNNDYNNLNSNIYITYNQSLTFIDFTYVNSSTLYSKCDITTDQTIGIKYESNDIGFNELNSINILKKSSNDIKLLMTSNIKQVTLNSFDAVAHLSQSDITSTNITEFNDFYIKFDATDSSSVTATTYLTNSENYFDLQTNNKLNWLAQTSYYKLDSSTVISFILLPNHNKIMKLLFDYNVNKIDSTQIYLHNNNILVDFTYLNQFNLMDDATYIDTTMSLQYEIPLCYSYATNILQLYNDVSNTLTSISMLNGSVINTYTNIIARFKEIYQFDEFKLYYDTTINNELLRYFALLKTDGTLSIPILNDILTPYIINNKITDITNIIITDISNNMIDFTMGSYIVNYIDLGYLNEFRNIDQYYENTDLIYVQLVIRDLKSHCDSKKILIINKHNQNYNIKNSKFDYIIDESVSLNKNAVLRDILEKSTDIVKYQESDNYPLQSNFICYYNDDKQSIKQLDVTNGFIYKLDNINIYNGVFLYTNTNYASNYKEFAIWDKMHASMQYHDDLPLIDFNKHSGINFVADYFYDSSKVYILLDICPSISKVSVKIKPAICIDYNYDIINMLDTSYYRNEKEEITLFDFSGSFPSMSVVLNRTNKVRDVINENRFLKLTLDYTFAYQNFLNLDVTSLFDNPFGSFLLQYQSSNNINDCSYYIDYLNNNDNITKRLFPKFNQYDNSVTNIDTLVMTDNTKTISQYLDTFDKKNNYVCLLLSLCNDTSFLYQDATRTELPYYKVIDSAIIGSIKLEYNKYIFDIYDKQIELKNFDSFKYDIFSAPIGPVEKIHVKYIPEESKLDRYLSDLIDAENLIKQHNHEAIVTMDISNNWNLSARNIFSCDTIKEVYTYDFDSKNIFNDKTIIDFECNMYNLHPANGDATDSTSFTMNDFSNGIICLNKKGDDFTCWLGRYYETVSDPVYRQKSIYDIGRDTTACFQTGFWGDVLSCYVIPGSYIYNKATITTLSFTFNEPIQVNGKFQFLFTSLVATSLSDEPQIYLQLYFNDDLIHSQLTTNNMTKQSFSYNNTKDKVVFTYPLLENGSGISRNSEINKSSLLFNKIVITSKSHRSTFTPELNLGIQTYGINGFQYSSVSRFAQQLPEGIHLSESDFSNLYTSPRQPAIDYYGEYTVNEFPIYNIDIIDNEDDYYDKITCQTNNKRLDIRNRSGYIATEAISSYDKYLITTQLGNANSKEFNLISTNNIFCDATLYLFGLDGTYDITKDIDNSWDNTVISIPKFTTKIRIREIYPETPKSVPTVSVHCFDSSCIDGLTNVTILSKKM